MVAALLVFAYSAVMAWWLPMPLTPLTRKGAGARLGIAAWLTAMASVLGSAGVALAFLIRSAVTGWSRLAEAVCRSVAGGACTPVVYRSALYELGLGLAAIVATLTAVVLAWRYGRRVQQAQRRTRAHAEAARITGQKLPAGTSGTVVLKAAHPAAYCLPGRPGTIVVTTGALAVLEPAQLRAVLAHERAHLAGRHHLLIALIRGLAAIFPCAPLFSRASGEIARLTEMRADDVALRHAGRRPLVEALLAMGTGAWLGARLVPGLAAASYAVAARVQRLVEPVPRASQTRCALALVSLLLVLPALSGLIFALAASS